MSEDEFRAKLIGRILAAPIYHPETGEMIADAGEEISDRTVRWRRHEPRRA